MGISSVSPYSRSFKFASSPSSLVTITVSTDDPKSTPPDSDAPLSTYNSNLTGALEKQSAREAHRSQRPEIIRWDRLLAWLGGAAGLIALVHRSGRLVLRHEYQPIIDKIIGRDPKNSTQPIQGFQEFLKQHGAGVETRLGDKAENHRIPVILAKVGDEVLPVVLHSGEGVDGRHFYYQHSGGGPAETASQQLINPESPPINNGETPVHADQIKALESLYDRSPSSSQFTVFAIKDSQVVPVPHDQEPIRYVGEPFYLNQAGEVSSRSLSDTLGLGAQEILRQLQGKPAALPEHMGILESGAVSKAIGYASPAEGSSHIKALAKKNADSARHNGSDFFWGFLLGNKVF